MKQLSYLYWHRNSPVNFDANIDSSVVSLMDVSFFVDELNGMNELIAAKGRIKDPINDLKLNDVFLAFGSSSYFKGDFELPATRNHL